MYNYTSNHHDIPRNNPNKLEPIYLIISLGSIIYSLCGLFHIDINLIIINRDYKYIFNIVMLFSSIVIIVNIIYINYIFNIINVINDIYQFIFFS